MQKIIMLGTGHGMVYDLYNTCFVLQNDDKYFLVDTGGSAQIINNLSKKKISVTDIHDIFISHFHTDHLLGLFWILKNLSGLIIDDKYDGNLTIYCNDEVKTSINNILPNILPEKLVEAVNSKMQIIVLHDNNTLKIADREFTFFDTKSRGNKLYGFETILDSGKKLVFLGDETCNPLLYDRIKNSDYVMHEAFCLDSDADIFHPYKKNHSTVKSVCMKLKELNIKNLILFHTEETHINNRKELYVSEGKNFFNGNIIVPDDLEELEL